MNVPQRSINIVEWAGLHWLYSNSQLTPWNELLRSSQYEEKVLYSNSQNFLNGCLSDWIWTFIKSGFWIILSGSLELFNIRFKTRKSSVLTKLTAPSLSKAFGFAYRKIKFLTSCNLPKIGHLKLLMFLFHLLSHPCFYYRPFPSLLPHQNLNLLNAFLLPNANSKRNRSLFQLWQKLLPPHKCNPEICWC